MVNSDLYRSIMNHMFDEQLECDFLYHSSVFTYAAGYSPNLSILDVVDTIFSLRQYFMNKDK